MQTWHQQAVGGHWKEIGELQYDFLVEHGLTPDQRLVDVACGSFRAGRHLIGYLDPDNYVGVDGNWELLDTGVREVLGDLLDRDPTISFVRLPAPLPTGDVVWMHALLDHMPPDQGLRTLQAALAAAPRVLATVFLVDDPARPHHWLRNGSQDGAITTFRDREYWHHDQAFLARVGASYELHEYAHPLGLTVVEFHR